MNLSLDEYGDCSVDNDDLSANESWLLDEELDFKLDHVLVS